MKPSSLLLSISIVVGSAAVAFGSLGCGGSADERLGTSRIGLRRAHDCSDLHVMLKDDAFQKMNARIDAQIALARESGSFYGMVPREMSSSSGATGGTVSATAPPSDRAHDWSETNVQVAGVDEGDIVDTDGKNIYLLHGQNFVVVRAWPPASMEKLQAIRIEGEPSEMMVTGDRAIIFSTVDGDPIYAAAGASPRAAYNDAILPVPMTGAATMGIYRVWQAHPLTKITVLGLDGDARTANVVREAYFEGGYTASRRTNTTVRALLRGVVHGPNLVYWPTVDVSNEPSPIDAWIAQLEMLRIANAQAIDATSIADWLPLRFAREGGDNGTTVTATTAACEDFYVPTAPTQSGLTNVVSFDASGNGDLVVTSVVGATDIVYATPSTMVLAAKAWGDPVAQIGFFVSGSAGSGSTSTGGGATTGSGSAGSATATKALTSTSTTSTTLDWTYLHELDLASDPRSPTYVASGAIPGQINDQFSIDTREGYIRVATTEQRWSRDGSTSTPATVRGRLFVLRAERDELRVVGDAGEIAFGERVYSTRFVGNRGYMVTFRRVDPLFVFDLADPTKPTKLGELELPGFSTYMQPLGDNHLLTIGQDADETGRVKGLALRIFDVTNGGSPRLAHDYLFRDADYGYSDALHDHHAFTFFPARGLLTFPFVAYGPGGQMRSSAEVFHVDVASGFARLGAVDHSALFASKPNGWCGGYFGPQVRRGIFLEDVLVSISYGGLIASDTHALTTAPLSSLPLDAPAVGAPLCKE